MQRLFSHLLIVSVVLLHSCSSKTGPAEWPAPPASAKAVQDGLKGNTYKAVKCGTHSPFKDNKEIEWLDPKKVSEFEKKIADESNSLQLNFTNDTAVVVSVNNKTYTGTYAADDKQGEDEKPGVKLRLSYVDEEFSAESKVTYTYLIEGMNDKSLLLETPRSMNDRKLVVLMTRQ